MQEFGIIKATELAEFNKIDPNFGKEYLQNYNNINKVVLSEVKRSGNNQTMGTIGALALIAAFIGAVIYLLTIGECILAVSLFGGSVVLLVTALLVHSKKSIPK